MNPQPIVVVKIDEEGSAYVEWEGENYRLHPAYRATRKDEGKKVRVQTTGRTGTIMLTSMKTNAPVAAYRYTLDPEDLPNDR